MLVVYHGEAGPRQVQRFAEAADRHGLRIEVCSPTQPERLAELLPEMDAWWHVLTPITAEALRPLFLALGLQLEPPCVPQPGVTCP